MSQPERGLFFALEGGEGSGKSSAAQRLAVALSAQGYDYELTLHPGGTALGRKIREMLLHRQEFDLTAEEQLQLFAIDFCINLREAILPAVSRGAVVIADRYTASTRAYQGVAGELDKDFVEERLKFWTEGIEPDRYYLIDIEPALGLARSTGGGDKIEAQALEFHQAVRLGYLVQAAANPELFLVVDGSQPPETVKQIILADMLELIDKRGIKHAAIP